MRMVSLDPKSLPSLLLQDAEQMTPHRLIRETVEEEGKSQQGG